METSRATLESTCKALSQENKDLKLKMVDPENILRRNNIQSTGLPEKMYEMLANKPQIL